MRLLKSTFLSGLQLLRKVRLSCDKIYFKMYRYTVGSNVLTDNHRKFYEDNGYIIVRNNVDHALLDELRQHFLDICNGKVDPGFMIVLKDPSLKNKCVKGEDIIYKIQDFLYDDVLFKYVSYKNVINVVKDIIGPNVTAAHSMLINKPPNADPNASLHPLHQDLYYFPFRPANKICASWTAMEPVDARNGCLYVIPGSHKSELLKHEFSKVDFRNKLLHGVYGLDNLPKVYITMDKGDTVFFHSLLLHGSDPNTTGGFRKSISCHYADSNCHFINVKGTIQEEISKVIEETVARGGAHVDFADVWKSKSRLVTGIPGNFQRLSHL